MAIDSRDKRFSIMGLGQPALSVLPNPSGTIGTAAKAQLLYLYSGIALGSPLSSADKIFSVIGKIETDISVIGEIASAGVFTVGKFGASQISANGFIDPDGQNVIGEIVVSLQLIGKI